MDFAGLSEGRGARSVAGHRPSGARDRRGRRAHGSVVRPGSTYAGQGSSTPTLTVNPPAGDVDRCAAAAETADRLQADYFLRLLTQNRRLIDHRIDGHHKAIAVSEASGDVEGASAFRRMARIEEQERQTLDGLIENLRRRFPVPTQGEVAPVPRRTRAAVR